jgi:hypothetical protein
VELATHLHLLCGFRMSQTLSPLHTSFHTFNSRIALHFNSHVIRVYDSYTGRQKLEVHLRNLQRVYIKRAMDGLKMQKKLRNR